MPVPREGYCTRQYSASSRMKIVASDHDLGLLRTITRVPSGHLLSGSGAPDAGALEAAGSLPVAAAASSAPALGGASLGSSLSEKRGLDSTRENRRQEEFNNRGAEVRRRVARRSVGWRCRRGGRRLRVCWPAGAGGRDGGGSGYWRAGRTGVCGRTGRGARPERLWG